MTLRDEPTNPKGLLDTNQLTLWNPVCAFCSHPLEQNDYGIWFSTVDGYASHAPAAMLPSVYHEAGKTFVSWKTRG